MGSAHALAPTVAGLTARVHSFMQASPLCCWVVDCDVLGLLLEWTVQDVYESVMSRLPGAVAKALTDDFTTAVPFADITNMESSYEMCGLFFRLVADEAANVGLALNFSKCKLLVPAHVPDPPQGCIPQGVKLVCEGLRTGGAPNGTDDYVKQFCLKQVKAVRRKLEAIKSIKPQLAFRLLCTSSGFLVTGGASRTICVSSSRSR